MINLFDNLKYLLYPKRCACCGELLDSGKELCASCGEKLSPLPGCLPLLKTREAIFFRAASFCAYSGSGAAVIKNFKFNGDKSTLTLLGRWLNSAFDARFSSAELDLICSVPIFDPKGGEHPLDHSALLARELSKHTGLPFVANSIIKTRSTKRQHELSAAERKTNLKGAFSASPLVAGKRILIADDVLTTGATLSECARTLLAAGAATVSVITVAATVQK